MFKYTADEIIDARENIWLHRYVVEVDEKEHTHDFIEIEYIWQGRGYQVINGVTYPVERGDLLFLNFGDAHSFSTSHELGVVNCIVNPEFFSNELVNSTNALDILSLTSFKDFGSQIASILPKVRFLGKDLIEVEAIIDFMESEFRDKNTGYLVALKGYMSVLLTKIFRAIKKTDTADVYGDIHRITPEILRFIEENYHKKITLKDLAKYSFYNPTYFSSVFKDCFGKTVTEYIAEKRIGEAIRRVEGTDHSIEAIAFAVGYRDKKQFYKAFREFTGMTPNQYRNAHTIQR